jgi:hypothetical protein
MTIWRLLLPIPLLLVALSVVKWSVNPSSQSVSQQSTDLTNHLTDQPLTFDLPPPPDSP